MHHWSLTACIVLGASLAHAYDLCVPAGTAVAQRLAADDAGKPRPMPQILYFEDHAPGLNPGLALLEKGIFDFPAGFFPSEEAHALAAVHTKVVEGSATKCCRLAGFNSFCADPELSDGIVIDFDVDDASTGESRSSVRGVSASNTSGQVAISPESDTRVDSITSTGRKLVSTYSMKSFPPYKLAHVSVIQFKHATDPYNEYDCSYQQLIAAVGTQVRFDVPNECIQVCGRGNRVCSNVMFCSQRVPNPNSNFVSRFHFGVASFKDQSRQIEIAMVDAREPELSTYDLSLFVNKNCYYPIGENWRVAGKVVVSSNPARHRFDVVIMGLEVIVGINAFNAGNVPLPG